LVAPEIHWNTGNIGRTCVGAGVALHLIKPLGFSLDDRHLKRAGLDYWHKVDLRIWDDFDHFYDTLAPADKEMVIFSKQGRQVHWKMPSYPRLFLIFGSEAKGLPSALWHRFAHRSYHIPITRHIRSLNLSTAVAIAVYESLREAAPPHDWPSPTQASPQATELKRK
jgi:tRNA (cytidine/uridine-2'-O-)-methyltransferase